MLWCSEFLTKSEKIGKQWCYREKQGRELSVDETWKKKSQILKLQEDDPSFLVGKGGREVGCQAVPLLHLTAVQNDSWRLRRRHHGRADVAAAFQVQQHFIPPLLRSFFFLSLFLFIYLFFPFALKTICLCPFIFSCTSYSDFFSPSMWSFCWFSFFDFTMRGNVCVWEMSPSKKKRADSLSIVHLHRLISSQHAPVVKRLFSSTRSWGTADNSLAHIRHYFHSS